MKKSEKTLEEVLKNSKKGVNPILMELYNSLIETYTPIKILSLQDKVKVKDFIFKSNDDGTNALLTPLKECQLSLIASVGKNTKELNFNKNPFGDNSKLVDLSIAVNVFGKACRNQESFESSILNFALFDRVMIATDLGLEIQKSKSIVYLEGNDSITKIYYLNGTVLESKEALGWFEANLPKKQFVRISKMHMINEEYIKFIEKVKDDTTVKLDTTHRYGTILKTLKVNRTYLAHFQDFLGRTFSGKN